MLDLCLGSLPICGLLTTGKESPKRKWICGWTRDDMSYGVLFIQQGARVPPKLHQRESRRYFLEQNLIIFPSFSIHKHHMISWHSCWKAFDEYFWDFLPFLLSLDELVLESLLQIFNMLLLKSGLSSPAGTSHVNPMTLLPFPSWTGWRTRGSSEFVTGAVSAAESRELVRLCIVRAAPCCVGTPAQLLSELLAY